MMEIILILMGAICASVFLLVFFFIIGTYFMDRTHDG
jgi:hypothetical protein